MPNSDHDLRGELERARSLAADGLQGEALILLRKIIRDRPDASEAYYLIAGLLLTQEAYDEALEAAERCLGLDPENDRAKTIRDACQEALTKRATSTSVIARQPGTFVYEAPKRKVPTRRCPSCGQEITRGARLCRHCGASIGMPPWLWKISTWAVGVGVIVVLFHLLTSVAGRRSLDPVLLGADGMIVESPSPAGEEIAIRLDRLRWHPGGIFPLPIPADSGDQIRPMSHEASCDGHITNASSELLAYVVIYAHFSGRTGIPFGAAQAEVIGVSPGESKEFSMSARLGNYASNCEISIGEIQFGPLDEELTRIAAPAQPTRIPGFPWGRFILMSALSSILLFVAARLQLACDPKIAWDYELRADALASVLAVPFIALATAWIFFLRSGLASLAEQRISLGPIASLAMVAPFLLLLIVLSFLFKRGCGGLFLIWFFFGSLSLILLGLMG